MKKMLVLLLTLCLLAGMVPLGAGAVEGTSCEDGTECTHAAAIGDKHYDTLQGAIDAATPEARVTLCNDINLSDPITVSKTLTLDLARHKIANTSAIWDDTEKHWSLIRVSGAGNLTITGDGTLEAREDDCFAVDLYDRTSKCTIDNGKFIGNIHAVYVYEGDLTVNGGTFSVKQKYSPEYPDEYVLNCYDDSYNNRNASITVKGGTFLEFNPQNCRAEGEDTNFCAEGYVGVIEKTEGKNTYYTVKPLSEVAAKIGERYFKTLADAVAAVHEETGEDRMKEHVITLLKSVSGGGFGVGYESLKDSDGEITAIGNSPVNIVIDLGQNKYTIEAPTVGSSGTETNGFQFLKGSSVTICNGSMELKSGIRCAYLFQNYADLTLENVSVDISKNEACEALLQTMHGKVDINGNTSLISGDTYTWDESDSGIQKAIKVMDWNNSAYGDGTQVTIDTTGTIDGSVYAGYYTGENEAAGTEKSTLTIKNGHFTKDISRFAHANSPDISISGGYFTSDPSDYVATGYYAGESDNPAYAYQVKEGKAGTEPAKVVAAEPDVATTGINNDDDAKKVADALKDTTADLTAAANEQAANNKVTEETAREKLKEAEIIEDGDNNSKVTVVVQPYLEMKATGYSDDTDVKTMTVDIKAMYRTVATTAKLGGENPDKIIVSGEAAEDETANAVVIGEKENTLPVEGPVKISIPLPTGFITKTESALPTIYVQHKGYEYEAEVTSNGETTATFTNPHGFSTFVLSTKSETVATVNGTNYTNFQQAVNAAGRNGTIEVKADGQIATGVTYNLTLKNDGTDSITVTINGETITIPAGETKPFTYTAPTPPRPTEEKHSITISTDGKGQVTGPASAAEDDTVTLTVKPGADKELYDLKVTDEDGKAIAVTKVNDTTYTFTMPDGKVTVAATFGCDGGDNCPSKAFTDLGDKQWYHDSIDYAVENGLLEGTSPTTMEPNATLIRAQLAQILYNIEDKPAVTGEMVFEDVPASEWFYSAILWANQNEIINGTSPTTFEPLENISRQDLALMLYRYAGEPAVTGDLDGFTDADQVGDWAEEAMAWAVAEGIVQGDTPTTLNPTGTATRAEAAAMLQRFLEDAA